MKHRVYGETVVRWVALVPEEVENNAEDAIAKACEEAEDRAVATYYGAPGIELDTWHHSTRATGCERIEDSHEREGCGEDRLNLAGDGRPDHGGLRTAVGTTLQADEGRREETE